MDEEQTNTPKEFSTRVAENFENVLDFANDPDDLSIEEVRLELKSEGIDSRAVLEYLREKITPISADQSPFTFEPSDNLVALVLAAQDKQLVYSDISNTFIFRTKDSEQERARTVTNRKAIAGWIRERLESCILAMARRSELEEQGPFPVLNNKGVFTESAQRLLRKWLGLADTRESSCEVALQQLGEELYDWVRQNEPPATELGLEIGTEGVVVRTSQAMKVPISGRTRSNLVDAALQLVCDLARTARSLPSWKWAAAFPIAVFTLFLFFQFSQREIPQELLVRLGETVQEMDELVGAPTPQLQMEFLANKSRANRGREILSSLAQYEGELPREATEKAALLAFALEDYAPASAFVESGLKSSPEDRRLLASLGLIQYERSSYKDARETFKQAAQLALDTKFQAAMEANKGLAHWRLGETDDARQALSYSVGKLTEVDADRQSAYVLGLQADLHEYLGDLEKARKLTNQALEQTTEPGERGRIYRQVAEVDFLGGNVEEARQRLNEALKIHKETSRLLDLAQDKDLEGEIYQHLGDYSKALRALEEAAGYYADIAYRKGLAENQIKRATVLMEMKQDSNEQGKIKLDPYKAAKELLDEAAKVFSELKYTRGLGETEALTGTLILREASHKISSGDMDSALAEKQMREARQHFKTALKHFEEIGYRRGIAEAEKGVCVAIMVYSSPDQLPEAVQHCETAAAIYREIGYRRGEADAYGNLGILLRIQGDHSSAISKLETALQIDREIGFKLGIGRQLVNLGRCYLERGDKRKAKEYFRSAKKMFDEIQPGYEGDLLAKLLEEV